MYVSAMFFLKQVDRKVGEIILHRYNFSSKNMSSQPYDLIIMSSLLSSGCEVISACRNLRTVQILFLKCIGVHLY